jgi:hypothetical protein
MKKAKALLQILAAFCLVQLSSCAQFGYQKAPQGGQVEHIVLLWLKQPGNADQRDKVIAAGKTLRDIPGVLSVTAGQPLASDRPIVDDSFDVGFVIRFASKAAGESYQTHPLHMKAVAEVLKPLAGKLLIYDYTVQ